MSSDEEPELQSSFSIKTIVVVSARDTEVPFDVKVVDGKNIMHAAASNRKLERIALAGTNFFDFTRRCKSFADVLKGMTKAKNEKFVDSLEVAGVKFNKQRRYTMKNIKHHVLQLPEVCQIVVGGGHINVLCTKPTGGLWIQASCESFTSVQNAVIDAMPRAQAEAVRKHMAAHPVAVASRAPESGDEGIADE